MTDGDASLAADAGDPSATPLAAAGEGVGTISVREAAKHYGVSERTIRRRIQDGALPAWRQETEHGYEWRIPLGTDAGEGGGVHHRQTAPLPSAPPAMPATPAETAAPELMKALEMVDRLIRENQQLAGQLGFTQAKLQDAQDQIKLLTAPKDEPAQPERRSWWRRLLG